MIDGFQFFAHPWWVNLLILIPIAVFFGWREKRILISKGKLLLTVIFAISFGLVEATVVVYLRAIHGLLAGYGADLSDIQKFSADTANNPARIVTISQSLAIIEMIREFATMVILLSLAVIVEKRWRERIAVFLWVFAAWDISYYLGLWLYLGWPPSLFTSDILFLIPVMWSSQVWFPLLVSALVLVAILAVRK
jgi:hypothetical protein